MKSRNFRNCTMSLMSLRRTLVLLPMLVSAMALMGCSPPERDEGCEGTLYPCRADLATCDGALRSCRADLGTAELTNQSCDATLETTRSDLASSRTENSQLQRRFRGAKSENRRLERDLREVQEANQKLEELFKKLDDEIEHHSLLLRSPEQLRVLEKKNAKKLKEYREAARNLKEGQADGPSIWSRLLGTDDDIDWDPDYLQERITEVEAEIRRIRYSYVLITRGATRLEELMGTQSGDGLSTSSYLLDGVWSVNARWRQSVAEMGDQDATSLFGCDASFNVDSARG